MPTLDGNARVQGSAGLVQRSAARLRGQGLPGRSAGAGRRSVRGRHDHGAEEADQEGARAVRAARRRRRSSNPGEGADGDHRTTRHPNGHARSPSAARGLSGSRRSPSDAGIHPELVRRLIRLGLIETKRRYRGRAAVPPPGRADARARGAPATRSRPELRRARCSPASCLPGSMSWNSGCAPRPPTHTTARGDRMDPNRLTLKSQEALHDAQTKALRYGHTEVDTAHLLLALLEQPEGLVPRLLARADVDTGALASCGRGRARTSAAGQRPGRRRRPDRDHAALSGSCWTPPSRRRSDSRTSTSPSSTSFWRCWEPGPTPSAGQSAARVRRRPGSRPRDPHPGPGGPARDERYAGDRPTRRSRSTAATS